VTNGPQGCPPSLQAWVHDDPYGQSWGEGQHGHRMSSQSVAHPDLDHPDHKWEPHPEEHESDWHHAAKGAEGTHFEDDHAAWNHQQQQQNDWHSGGYGHY
jgi:hypothetical protein